MVDEVAFVFHFSSVLFSKPDLNTAKCSCDHYRSDFCFNYCVLFFCFFIFLASAVMSYLVVGYPTLLNELACFVKGITRMSPEFSKCCVNGLFHLLIHGIY